MDGESKGLSESAAGGNAQSRAKLVCTETATSRTPNTAQTASRVALRGSTQVRARTENNTRCMHDADSAAWKTEHSMQVQRATN